MRIGQLHSWIQKDMWIPFNAILIRHQFETWDYARKNGLNYWKLKYGKGSKREKLRDLIYQYNNLDFLHFAQHYDLVFLSINFDDYPSSSDFVAFVKDVVSTYKMYYPNKEIILGIGNECWEKVRNVDRFIKVVWDTDEGRRQAGGKYGSCFWNQKIYTSEEKKAYNTLLNNSTIKSICKYVGYQSLGTKACDLATYIRYAKNLGYEPVDVELGHQLDSFSSVEELLKIGIANGVEIFFILAPYITKQLADFDKLFGNYGLQILRDNGTIYQTKPKYALIDYVQKFKMSTENGQGQKVNKMLNEAINGTIYKQGTKGYIPKLIQKCLNKFLKEFNDEMFGVLTEPMELLVEDGLFGTKTKNATMLFQTEYNFTADGVVGQNTMTALIKFFLGVLK